jgi:hypothetical protein
VAVSSFSWSMVIHDFHVVHIFALPAEANAAWSLMRMLPLVSQAPCRGRSALTAAKRLPRLSA